MTNKFVVEKRELHALREALLELKDLVNDQRTDFSIDFSKIDISNKLDKVLAIVSGAETLNFNLLLKIKNILGFKRIYTILEFADKIRDIERLWSKMLLECAKRFLGWGLSAELVRQVANENVGRLRKAFVELVFRKGLGQTEINAIEGFRWNMGNRLPEEYLFNLVRGWAYEDLVKVWLERRVKRIKNVALVSTICMAHDRERIIRFRQARTGRGRVITGEPDFLLKICFNDGRIVKLFTEIQFAEKSRKKRSRDLAGFELVRVPSHRIGKSQKFSEEGAYFLVFLWRNPEDATGKGDEIAFVIKPHENLEEKNGEIFVKAKFFPINDAALDTFLAECINAC